MSLEDIKKQPVQLGLDKIAFEKQLSQVTCDEYRSFLNAHEHLEELTKVDEIPVILTRLQDHLPIIEKHLSQCETSHKDSIETRKKLNIISQQLDNLEPILEIPVLFDTLIRNNHYEEAMDLQLFSQRLPLRYPEIPLLEKLATIKSSSQAMLNQLFSMLRGPAKLPICIRVIGYLKRLDFDDAILRVLFLVLRFEYLNNLLSLVKEPQPQDYMRRWIETQREHFFDIITHYKAIFADPKYHQLDVQILSSFSNHATSEMFQVLDNYLDQTFDMTYFPSLNMQLMYYGMSLGRVGLDFRPMVVSRFEFAVV
jgi:hypothetical protein